MSLNPIVALTEKFEKLITEHGSATIQSKHIALLKDQFAFLEKENAKLNTKLEKFVSKHQILRTENANLKKENAKLLKIIHTFKRPSQDLSHITEQDKILMFLAENNDEMFPVEAIMSACDLSEHKTLYHVDRLDAADKITASYEDGVPYWYLDDAGRAYLVEKKLLK
jgi:hypothetical protein